MHSQNASIHHTWKPLAQFGLHGDFLSLNPEIILNTWAVLAIIIIVSLYVSKCLKNEKSLVRSAVIQYIEAFQDLLMQSIGSCPLKHLSMIGSLFTYILLCNTIQIIPWFEEPTKDLNTTLALGLISFLYVHSNSIQTKGLKHYIKHYFEPFPLMLPLHLVGTVSSIVSISFRLFGNIYGGCIISSLFTQALSGSIIFQTLGIVTGANFLMLLIFGVCEGAIQAFVFTMLTLTYLSMEISSESEHESTKTTITS